MSVIGHGAWFVAALNYRSAEVRQRTCEHLEQIGLTDRFRYDFQRPGLLMAGMDRKQA